MPDNDWSTWELYWKFSHSHEQSLTCTTSKLLILTKTLHKTIKAYSLIAVSSSKPVMAGHCDFADLVHVVSRKQVIVERKGPKFGPRG